MDDAIIRVIWLGRRKRDIFWHSTIETYTNVVMFASGRSNTSVLRTLPLPYLNSEPRTLGTSVIGQEKSDKRRVTISPSIEPGKLQSRGILSSVIDLSQESWPLGG